MTKVELDTIIAYENYRADTIIDILKHYDDLYYNDGTSPISDEVYDAMRIVALDKDPTNVYFTGVGSTVRGGKIDLPYEMGSLNQIYDGDYEKWIAKHDLYEADILITEKLDGHSDLVVYGDDGKIQIGYSRGDGIQGADITRHLHKFKTLPKQLEGHTAIRGEIILTKDSFEILKSIVKTRGGEEYKNARNMVAGLMNAESNDDIVYKHLQFVAYELKNTSNIGRSAWEGLMYLKHHRFQIPQRAVYKGKDLNDRNLPLILKNFKSNSRYEIDGLVLEVDGALRRTKINPTRDTLNPEYAVKYKVADEDNVAIATVEEVEWNVSKHGLLKPRVRISPVDLVGVTITYATGFNAKFINDNLIGPGSKIQITRSGDVIPFIQSVVEGTFAQMPTENWDWNATQVDAVMIEHEASKEVMMKQVLHFFTTINIPNLKEGIIKKMEEINYYESFDDAVLEMCNYKEEYWFRCIGENGKKIYKGLRDRLNEIPLYRLIGSTPYFGSGVGTRKFKKLITDLQIKSVGELPLLNKAQIISVDGFEDKTAEKIVQGINHFMWILEKVPYITVTFPIGNVEGKLSGEKIVFTGFRDKELQAKVEAEGGVMQSGVSGKTTILVSKTDKETGKIKKARDKGVKVMTLQEFKDMV